MMDFVDSPVTVTEVRAETRNDLSLSRVHEAILNDLMFMQNGKLH